MTPATGGPLRSALRRLGDALLWAALGAVVAPVAFAAGIALVAAVRSPDAPALGVLLYFLSFSLFASVAFALPPYAALLAAWAAVAPRLGGADRSRAGVALVTAVLALPAGVFMALANDGPPLPLFVPIWLAAWIGLLAPRLVVPRLAPGAFARRRTPAE